MAIKKMSVTVKGVSPMLMCNGQLVNPRNDFTRRLKAVTGKRKKTDDDHEEISHIEFLGGLYTDEKSRPCIPGFVLKASIVNGAKRDKCGKLAAIGVFVDGNFPLLYKGPTTPEKLWKAGFFDFRKVRVNNGGVMRTRPRFEKWSLTYTVHFDPTVVSEPQVLQFIENAGVGTGGLGDGRTLGFGRFKIVKHGKPVRA